MNYQAPQAVALTQPATKRIVELKPPFAKRLADAERIIFADAAVGAVRVTEPPRLPGKEPSSIYFFAREQDIRTILNDDATFTLHPYDVALKAAAGDVRFILGAESDALRERRAMIAKVIGAPGSPSYDAITEKVRVAAREASNGFLANLNRRRRESARFNVIRDYGYLIPYLTASRVVGLWGRKEPTLLVHSMVLLRNLSLLGNLFRFGRWLRLGPEQKSCQTTVMWSHLIFGHIFTNFENRNGVMLMLATRASRELSRHIEDVMARSVPGLESSLLTEFLNKRDFFAHLPNATYRSYVRSILFEFTGAMTLLVAISFGRVLDALARQNASWPGFLSGISGQPGERLINEALRLNSTTQFLFRRVARRTEVSDVSLHPGDHVCVLVGGCGRAGGPFRKAPPPNSEFLNFGPHGGPHSCFGQKWARVILQEMLAELAALQRLRPVEGQSCVREFAGLPDAFEMYMAPPPQP